MNELIMTQTMEHPQSESDSSPEDGGLGKGFHCSGGSEKRRKGKQRLLDRKNFRKRILSAPFLCKSRSDTGSLGRLRNDPEPV